MWERLSRVFLDRLGEATRLTGRVHHSIRLPSRPKGRKIALNPTYKIKGPKHNLASDRKGIPLLAVMISAANVHDSMVLEEIIDAVKHINRPRGRPRKRTEKTLNRYGGNAEHLHGHLQELHQEWNLSCRDP